MAKKSSTTSSTPSAPRKRTTKKPNGSAPGPVPPLSALDVTDDDIRVRAYHRYLERGASHGADFDDWVEAERDLKSSRS